MRERNENGYRHSKSKNSEFTPHLSAGTSERLKRYCSIKNINKTKFVEQCVISQLDVLEKKCLEMLSKDELIALVLKEQNNDRKCGTDNQMALPI